MAIFAGKYIYGAAFELQPRVFLKPWATRIVVRCCSNLDESSTNFPVRYTPKRSSKYNKLNDFTPAPKDPQNFEVRRLTNPDSSNTEFSSAGERSGIGFYQRKSLDKQAKPGNVKSKEKKSSNSAVRSEAEEDDYKWRSADSNVMEGHHDYFDAMEGPEEDIEEELDSQNGKFDIKHLTLEPGKTKEEAEKTAVRLLAARAYTALELKKKLIGKKFSHEVVNAVISDFQNRGFINDLLYAESFSKSRWSSSSWGPRRIKQALVKKGVNDFDAQKAIKLVLEDGESVDDQVSRFGLSKSSVDHLYAQASKQWLRAKDLPSEKQKSRIINWLQYRGFNWGVITFILKKLQSEHPP